MPGDVPENWSEELLQPIPQPKAEELRQAYQNLTHRDELLVTYTPDEGSTVTLNGETLLTTSQTELMAGMVELFFGPDPVSEGVRTSLLGSAKSSGWF